MQDIDIDFLRIIRRDTTLTRVSNTDGGEYAGSCPFCGGKDRFRLWPVPHEGKPRYWCRRCERRGDAIQYLQERHHLSFSAALEQLGRPNAAALRDTEHIYVPETIAPPSATWQSAAARFAAKRSEYLWSEQGTPAQKWLCARGFSRESIFKAGLGYNPEDHYETRASWGLAPLWDEQGRPKQVWLPRGIVIPWEIGRALWRVNIRRLRDSPDSGGPKYIGPPGSALGLYGADGLVPGRPAVLVEGEFDALTVAQHANHLATPVATGSTNGARRLRWIAKLSLASAVLVAFDSDHAGEEASRYWLDLLPNAIRWRTYWGKDINEAAVHGGDIGGWVKAGLEQASDRQR